VTPVNRRDVIEAAGRGVFGVEKFLALYRFGFGFPLLVPFHNNSTKESCCGSNELLTFTNNHYRHIACSLISCTFADEVYIRLPILSSLTL
jgi:hypothetical protein